MVGAPATLAMLTPLLYTSRGSLQSAHLPGKRHQVPLSRQRSRRFRPSPTGVLSFDTSPRRSHHASLPPHSHAASRLLLSAPSWNISREGPDHASLPRFAHAAFLGLLLAAPVGASPGKALTTPPSIATPQPSLKNGYVYPASSRHLPVYTVGASLGRGSCHAFFHGHACTASGCHLPVHPWCTFREGPPHASLHQQRSRCLRPSPLAHFVGTSVNAHVMHPSIYTLTLPPAVFYRKPSLCTSREGPLPRLSPSGRLSRLLSFSTACCIS